MLVPVVQALDPGLPPDLGSLLGDDDGEVEPTPPHNARTSRASASDVATAVTASTGLETRIAVLGHIQRGGRPTAIDRILAARLGHAAAFSTCC